MLIMILNYLYTGDVETAGTFSSPSLPQRRVRIQLCLSVAVFVSADISLPSDAEIRTYLHLGMDYCAMPSSSVALGERGGVPLTAADVDIENILAERRPELAYAVRDWMRANDSATCRTCHEEESIKPARKRGRRQHEQAREESMTCIDCHYNLVHEEVEPRESFLDSAGGTN